MIKLQPFHESIVHTVEDIYAELTKLKVRIEGEVTNDQLGLKGRVFRLEDELREAKRLLPQLEILYLVLQITTIPPKHVEWVAQRLEKIKSDNRGIGETTIELMLEHIRARPKAESAQVKA